MANRITRYGFKGLVGLVGYDALPQGTKHAMSWVPAEDGGETRGILYARGGEKTAIIISHPRASVLNHYAVPFFLEGGFAVFCQEGRYTGNDTFCVHETCLLDVAASVKFLREKGFERVVAFGTSGGGSLYAFYQAQAETVPPGRLTTTPAGDPCDLNTYELPPVDGFVTLAAHPGQGMFLMGTIDPSITDEADPMSIDPALDMYDPRNGYREADGSASYSQEFLTRYREAQRARVARLDAIAMRHVEVQRRLAEIPPVEGAQTDDLNRELARRGLVGKIMVIYRTEADPRFCDLSIDPSARGLGSMSAANPGLSNYTENGHARTLSPRAWLSTWSGLSSRANLTRNIAHISVPTLFLWCDADNGVFSSGAEACLAAAKMDDRQSLNVAMDHYGRLTGSQAPTARRQVCETITGWMKERFPVGAQA